MHHGGSDPRFGESGSEGRQSDSGKCRSWSSQWVLHLTVVVLFLTSYGYDPYLRGQELEQMALEEDDDGVLLNVPSDFHDPEEEDPSEEAIEIQYHVLLYVPRMLAVILLAVCHQGCFSIDLLQKIVHFGHAVIALLYTLLYLQDFLSYELRYIGCLSELFWSSKLLLYVYQLAMYSPTTERLYYLIAGTLVLSLGSATHPLLAELGANYPIASQYMVNLAIALLQLGIFQPIMLFGPCATREKPSTLPHQIKHDRLNRFIVEILIATLSLNSVTLQWFLTDNSTLLRPFLPFLSADDLFGTFWQLFYVAVVYSTIGLLLIYLHTSDLMVASFCGQFLAGVLYFYLEEPIVARFGLIMNTCSLATGLEQLFLLRCGNDIVGTLGFTFTMIHVQTYAFFMLLLALWSSPDIVIVVVLAFNGFFALVLIVFRRWLNCEPIRPDSVEKMFSTQITTIT
ncbi:uncharacterized protein LOC126557998 [Anopheles maculipalpis]|uniref:uncharacterized protein LOC126557998 n=1 Tax=Anopheles maculipalpis TaxID=1496333 RepID=UPI002159955F|nr:uncharacterized protein LOC126557998 [Anopheles maculipalpis]